MSRNQLAIVWTGVLVVLVFVAAACDRNARPLASITSLESRIGDHRRRGDYTAASGAADSLVTILRKHRSGEIEKAGAVRLAATLHRVSSMDRISRSRLADADRLAASISELTRAGKPLEAYEAARRELEIRRHVLGSIHEEVAENLNRVGNLAAAQGLFAEAVDWHTRGLEMREQVLGSRHPSVASSLNRLARDWKNQGENRKAKDCLEQALALERAALGPNAPEMAETLMGLANLHRLREEFPQARKLIGEALRIRRRALGENSLEAAGSRMDLGLVLLRMHDWAGAERELRHALATERRFLGPDHPDLCVLLSLLGHSQQARGRYSAAADAHRESARIAEVARTHWKRGTNLLYSRLIQYEDLAANLLAMRRDEEAWPTLEHARGRMMADLMTRPASPEHRSTATHDRDPRGHEPSLEAMQAALPPHAAMIGWLDVTPGAGEPHSAWGYVIRDRGPVSWIRLETREALGTHAAAHTNQLLQLFAMAGSWPVRVGPSETADREGVRLWRERVAPLMPRLEGVEELIVENSGGFECPIEALVDSTGAPLVQRFAISYTPSAAVYLLLREQGMRHRPSRGRRALLVGDPPFTDDQSACMERESKNGTAPDLEDLPERVRLPEPRVLRAAANGDSQALLQLPRLTETRWEVERLSKLMPGSTVLLGKSASESNLYDLERSRRFERFDTIHLASHYLYSLPPERSSIVLALPGTTKSHSGDMTRDADDGLLRWIEIIDRLPVRADLVTLSGCLSGVVGGHNYGGSSRFRVGDL